MRIYPFNKSPVFTLVAVVLLLTSPLVVADGGATRTPANSAGDDQTSSAENGEIIDLNPSRLPVVTPDGMESVTSMRVDSSTALIQGYVAYDLDQAQSYPTTDDATSAVPGGFITLDTFLAAPGNPNAPDTVDITIEIDLTGIFEINTGAPTMILQGDIALTTFDPTNPFDGLIYQTTFGFLSSALNDVNNPVSTNFASTVNALLGDDPQDFDGGAVIIDSQVLDDLSAKLTLTVPVTLGDSFLLTGFVLGGIGPQPDPADIDPEDPLDVVASSGVIDYSNSANIRILVPEGYAFEGEDPLLDNVVLVGGDSDSDGEPDATDNCTNVSNASQLDSDGDGYGNACDGDFNNDCIVNFLDIAAFANEFLGTNAIFDLNGDGAVNFLDFSSLANAFLSIPGPGLSTGLCE